LGVGENCMPRLLSAAADLIDVKCDSRDACAKKKEKDREEIDTRSEKETEGRRRGKETEIRRQREGNRDIGKET
jgi:hypothetical protein